MKRRMSQAEAMRSTCTPFRVTQMRPLSSPIARGRRYRFRQGLVLRELGIESATAIRRLAALAPKKSIATTWASRAFRRASWVRASVRCAGGRFSTERFGDLARLLGHRLVVGVAGPVEQGADLVS